MITILVRWIAGVFLAVTFFLFAWKAGFRSGFNRGRAFEARRIAKEREEQAAAEEDDEWEDEPELIIEDREP